MMIKIPCSKYCIIADDNKRLQSELEQAQQMVLDERLRGDAFKVIVDKLPVRIVGRIIEDIEDRLGLRQEWRKMDNCVRTEIKIAWLNIVKKAAEAVREGEAEG